VAFSGHTARQQGKGVELKWLSWACWGQI